MNKISSYTIFRIAEDYPTAGKPSYGLQPVFFYLSREQVKLGNDVQVIALAKDNLVKQEKYNDVLVHRVKRPFNLNAAILLKKLLKDNKKTLIHTHATSGVFLRPLRQLYRNPIICHVHGTTISRHFPIKIKFENLQTDYSVSRVWYYYFRERYLWSIGNRVLTVSDLVRSDLHSYYSLPLDKIVPVFNGVDSDLFNRNSKVQIALPKGVENKRIILYVGHFGPRKGLPILFEAMKSITSQVQDAVLVCVGGVPNWLDKPSYLSQLLDSIHKMRLEERIFLLDRVPNDILPGYYSKACVFVLPSYYETFAKVVIEAMSCCVPVVATRGGGVNEVVLDGKTGLLVDYGSSEQLVKSIIYLLSNNKIAQCMGEQGRKRVEDYFTWKSVAERINNVYDDLYSNDKSSKV